MTTEEQSERTPSPNGCRPKGFTPDSKVEGTFRPPGSKSSAQRALLAALLADGQTELFGLPDGADVTAATSLVQAAGAEVTRLFTAQSSLVGGVSVRVRGLPPGGMGIVGGPSPVLELQLGESGTLARMATACMALCARPGSRVTLVPKGSLATRSSRALFRCLGTAGVVYLRQNLPGTWPVELESVTPPSTLHLQHPGSSQEVSALLLASAAWPDEIEVVVDGPIPSLPYVGLTRRLLEEFGVGVEEHIQSADGPTARRTYSVGGPLSAPPSPLTLEPDASSAAVLLAAACLSGGAVCIPGLGPQSAQGDVGIIDHLNAFGCKAKAGESGLCASGFPTQAAEVDLGRVPDLAPVLAVIAAAVAVRYGKPSLLLGLQTLPGKESDRIGVLADGLGRAGLRVEAGADRLGIAPGSKLTTEDLVLDSMGDHRMAFAFSLLGILRKNTFVKRPHCVGKSWRSYWDDAEALGAVLCERRNEA